MPTAITRLLLSSLVLTQGLALSVCAHSAHQSGLYLFDRMVPREIRKQIDWTISFPELKASPTSYEGRVVAIGGVVLNVKRGQGKTEIEVLQLPLNTGLSPVSDRTLSQGRFLAVQHASLDPATLEPDTPITVVGEVEGSMVKATDETEDIYPVVDVKRLVNWSRIEVPRYFGYVPYPYYYGYGYPYYGLYYPYWGPYGPYYPYYPFFPRSFGATPSPPSPPPQEAVPPQFKKRE